MDIVDDFRPKVYKHRLIGEHEKFIFSLEIKIIL